MVPEPGAGLIATLVGFFKGTTWPRLGLLLSSVVLIISLFTPSLPVRNYDLMWWSFWICVYFVIESAQGPTKVNRFNSLFWTAKLVAFLGLAYWVWFPWIEVIDSSPFPYPFVSNEHIVAFLFFAGASGVAGATINLYATFSCRRSNTRVYWYGGSFLAALVLALCVSEISFNTAKLVGTGFAVGVILGPLIAFLRSL